MSATSTMPLSQILTDYKPIGHEQGWDWVDVVMKCVGHERKYMHSLITDIQENGMTSPIVLGDDGTVLDGHHRIFAAMVLGEYETSPLPVLFEDADAIKEETHAAIAAGRTWSRS